MMVYHRYVCIWIKKCIHVFMKNENGFMKLVKLAMKTNTVNVTNVGYATIFICQKIVTLS